MKQKTCLGHKNCGVEKTIKIVSRKWTMHILHNLFEDKKRFKELERVINGISTKTLSQRLKELEREKIIRRTAFAEVPLHVEYSLTDKGRSLRDIFNKMAYWGETHN